MKNKSSIKCGIPKWSKRKFNLHGTYKVQFTNIKEAIEYATSMQTQGYKTSITKVRTGDILVEVRM